MPNSGIAMVAMQIHNIKVWAGCESRVSAAIFARLYCEAALVVVVGHPAVKPDVSDADPNSHDTRQAPAAEPRLRYLSSAVKLSRTGVSETRALVVMRQQALFLAEETGLQPTVTEFDVESGSGLGASALARSVSAKDQEMGVAVNVSASSAKSKNSRATCKEKLLFKLAGQIIQLQLCPLP